MLLEDGEGREKFLVDFVPGVPVGPGVRLPRRPAPYPRKRKWRPEQNDAEDYLEERTNKECPWQRNLSSVVGLSREYWRYEKVSIIEGSCRSPDLVVDSLGAIRKDKPNGAVTARVLFGETNGIHVNTRTRIREQEQSASQDARYTTLVDFLETLLNKKNCNLHKEANGIF